MITKIQEIFQKKINSNNFFLVFRFIFFFFLIILVLNFCKITLSKYTSETEVNVSPKIAFFITDIGTYENNLKLDSILPSVTPYYYSFTVSNFKESKKAHVNIEYEIEFVTTTNLPLNFKLYKNTSTPVGNGIINSDIITENEDGMYLRNLKTDVIGTLTYTQNQTDTYLLLVEFPENYKNLPEKYEGTIELVEIKVKAKQLV